VPVDRTYLASLRAFDDPASGYREEFLQPELGGTPTVAVLSHPLGPARARGWVLCHSFGIEQAHLRRLDVVVARTLAARGSIVLRYHGTGYADSGRPLAEVSLQSHVADAVDAVGLLAGTEGVSSVGIAGARFGGLVAALTAERLGLSDLAMWDPVVRGPLFMRDLLRTRMFAEMSRPTDAGLTSRPVDREFDAVGWVDVRGLRLTRQAHDQITGVDLLEQLTTFRGRSLLVGVSRTGRISRAHSGLVEHLRALGGDCTVELLQDRFAAEFGQYHYRFVDASESKRDIRSELDAAIASVTASWVDASTDPAAVASMQDRP
jgi:hypothetical protein